VTLTLPLYRRTGGEAEAAAFTVSDADANGVRAAPGVAVIEGEANTDPGPARPGPFDYGFDVDPTDPPLRVLVVGLDPYRVPGPWDPSPVADAIERGMARFAEHGVGVQTCLVGLDGSDDIAAVVTEALRAHPWECVVIGGGIRTADDQLKLFEQVINLVHRHAAGAAIAFNGTPEDTFEAAARWIDWPDRNAAGHRPRD